MDNNKMEQLKKKYKDIPIPRELDKVVEEALQKKNNNKHIFQWGVGVAAAAVIFTTSLNISPTFAKSLSDVPVVGSIVEVLTFKEYRVDEGNYQADIQVPKVDNMDNTALQESLNNKYLQESQQLYEKFMSDMEAQQAFGEDGHLRVDSGFEVKTETEQLLSIGRYVVETMASATTTLHYDTIDKQNELLITLPSLFKDNSYVEVISENVKQQMHKQMKEDDSKIYWVEETDPDAFKSITENQNFYINENNELVISFNEYEVAPGYMGIVEFVIPTEVLQDIVVSNEYLK